MSLSSLARLLRAGTCAALTAIPLLGSSTPARAAPPTPAGSVPRVAHVVVIMFENHERGDVLGTSSAPTFNRLAADYAQATDVLAVAHPSLPNYLALVSGSTHGVTDDCTDCMQTGPTIASQLAARHRSALTYAEGYPSSSRFAKKHVPFLYFPQSVPDVVAIDRFDARHLPAYAMVVPDLCHDMHDCSVAEGDRWLKRFIGPLLTTPDTAVFVVFDEGTSDIGGGGRVPLIMLGSVVRPHAVFRGRTSHYGVLRTMEAMLGLRPLGLARGAALITGVWK
jgi:phosphatidylinositol-3-phosphatase